MVAIWRSNRERSITVYANVKAGESQQKALQAAQDIAKRILPPDYHITLTGSSQTFTESLQSLFWVLMLGIVVAYMVLASPVQQLHRPALGAHGPSLFSVSGALMALLATHQSINIYSVIGLILLMGIVKKNSILLVDFTNQVREKGEESVRKALLTACPIRLAAHPDDLGGHHRGRRSRRPGLGPGRGKPQPHGHRGHRRRGLFDPAHALCGAVLLQRDGAVREKEGACGALGEC